MWTKDQMKAMVLRIYKMRRIWWITHKLFAIIAWALYYFTRLHGREKQVAKGMLGTVLGMSFHMMKGVLYYGILSMIAIVCVAFHQAIPSADARKWMVRGFHGLCAMGFPLIAAWLGVNTDDDETALYMFLFGVGSLISLVALFQPPTDFGLIDNLVGVALGIILQLRGRITWESVLISLFCIVRYLLTNLNKWLGPAPADRAQENQEMVVLDPNSTGGSSNQV